MFTTSGLAFQEAQDDTVKITISAGKLGGILMIPKDFKKGPVALIIQGSGPTDKDGNSAILGGKNNSLKMISQTLADLGIASLRFDKRGIGLSAASATAEKDLLFDDFINDATSWLDFLQKTNASKNSL